MTYGVSSVTYRKDQIIRPCGIAAFHFEPLIIIPLQSQVKCFAGDGVVHIADPEVIKHLGKIKFYRLAYYTFQSGGSILPHGQLRRFRFLVHPNFGSICVSGNFIVIICVHMFQLGLNRNCIIVGHRNRGIGTILYFFSIYKHTDNRCIVFKLYLKSNLRRASRNIQFVIPITIIQQFEFRISKCYLRDLSALAVKISADISTVLTGIEPFDRVAVFDLESSGASIDMPVIQSDTPAGLLACIKFTKGLIVLIVEGELINTGQVKTVFCCSCMGILNSHRL